jgi:hypothetical protein
LHNTASILYRIKTTHGIPYMTLEEFLDLKTEGFTFKEIGEFFGLTERQVNYSTKKWGLDFSKKKYLDEGFFSSGTSMS